ncbi:MAG: hypothetical protein HQL45_14445 [Alphaproteobacteria bacterium]|nr:hypothetical protein [Alphaproteobacteria bacterium]
MSPKTRLTQAEKEKRARERLNRSIAAIRKLQSSKIRKVAASLRSMPTECLEILRKFDSHEEMVAALRIGLKLRGLPSQAIEAFETLDDISVQAIVWPLATIISSNPPDFAAKLDERVATYKLENKLHFAAKNSSQLSGVS